MTGKGGHDPFSREKGHVPLFRIVSLNFQREGIKLLYGQALSGLTPAAASDI